MKEYQVSYRGNRFVTRDNIIDVLNELGYHPNDGEGGFELDGITNWYLLTDQDEGVQLPDMDLLGTDACNWRTTYQPPTANTGEGCVWRFTDFRYKDGSTQENPILHIYVGPELITKFTSGGGMGVEFAYALFDKEVTEVILSENDGELPVSAAPDAVPQEGGEWTKSLDSLSYDADSYLWMSQRKISADGIPGTWEKPIRLSGADGDPGKDAFDTEFIYHRSGRKPTSDDNTRLFNDNIRSQDDYYPNNSYWIWTDNPQGVDDDDPEHKYEWMAFRTRMGSTHPDYNSEHPEWVWSNWSDIMIWAAYGEKGMDGDGVQYIYNNKFIPTESNPIPGRPPIPKIYYNYDSNSGEYSQLNWYGDIELIRNGDPYEPNDWRPKGWGDGIFYRWEGGTVNSQGEWIPTGWNDEPQGVGDFEIANPAFVQGEPVSETNPETIIVTYPFEWVSVRKRVREVWGEFSEPTLWSTFSREHTISIEFINGKWVWVIDGDPTTVVAEGQNGKGIDLKGKVDYYDENHRDQLLADGFEEDPNHVYTFLSDVEDTYHPQVGDCYVVMLNGHIYLYVGGDEPDWKSHWSDFGEFQGEGAYVHIAWANGLQFDPNDHTTVTGYSEFAVDKDADGTYYEWMGICTDHSEDDPGSNKINEYKWNHVRGRDGDTFEKVYMRTAVEVRPLIAEDQTDSHGHTHAQAEYLPYVTNIADNLNVDPPIHNCQPDPTTNQGTQQEPRYEFTDDPQGVDSTYRYEWMAERKKSDGQWQSFGRASLWATYSNDGQSILRSTIFKRSESKPDPPAAPGSFSQPVPENSGWSNGIPPGTGPIWKTEKIFTSDRQPPQWQNWSDPTLVRDDENFDVELSTQAKDINGGPVAPVKYNEATLDPYLPCNSHRPLSGEEGYDESVPVVDQIWFDPELDSGYISEHSNLFNWMATRSRYVTVQGQPAWRPWTIILVKGEDGGTGASGIGFQHAYIAVPKNGTPNIQEDSDHPGTYISTNSGATGTWTIGTNGVAVQAGQALWMSERTVHDGIYGPWDTPVRLSGPDGSPGEDAENIEFIYKRSNRLPNNSSGNSDKPTLNDYTVDEYIPNYDLHSNDDGVSPSDNIPQNQDWTNSPFGVDPDHKYEWMCQRIKSRTTDPDELWGPWSNVFVWSAYGDTGMDGDGVEYIFYRRNTKPYTPVGPHYRTVEGGPIIEWKGGVVNVAEEGETPEWEPKDLTGSFYEWVYGSYNPQGEWIPTHWYTSSSTIGAVGNSIRWTDEPTGVGEEANPDWDSEDPGSSPTITYLYEWVSVRKRVGGEWGKFSEPTQWSNYAVTPIITIKDGVWVINGESTEHPAEGPAGQGIQLKDTVTYYDSDDRDDYLEDHEDDLDDPYTFLSGINPTTTPTLTVGDCYVVKSSRFLYVSLYNGSNWNSVDWTKNWDEIGEFQGAPGINSYMHIAWAASKDTDPVEINDVEYTVRGDNLNFDGSGNLTLIKKFLTQYEQKNPAIEYDWMGVRTDNDILDPVSNFELNRDLSNGVYENYAIAHPEEFNWSLYKWNNVRGRDGDNYERVYIRTKTETPKPKVNQDSYGEGEHQVQTKDEFLPQVNSYNSANHSSPTFTDDPVGVTNTYKFEWMAERRKALDTSTGKVRWFDFSAPSLWAKYSTNGMDGVSVQIKYAAVPVSEGLTITSASVNTGTPVGEYTLNGTTVSNVGWADNTSGFDLSSEVFLWMTQRTVRGSTVVTNWLNPPIRISGEDGDPGRDGRNIEFVYKLAGAPPTNPSTTDKPDSEGTYHGKNYSDDDYVPDGWTDNPSGVDNTSAHKYEWACQRVKPSGPTGTTSWGPWSDVFVWSAYGDTGMDGDGVEYVFFRWDGPSDLEDNNKFLKTPSIPIAIDSEDNRIEWNGKVYLKDNPNNPPQSNDWLPKDWSSDYSFLRWDANCGYYNQQGEWIPVVKVTDNDPTHPTSVNPNNSEEVIHWEDEPKGVGKFTEGGQEIYHIREWVSIRKRINGGNWGPFSEPKIWASFGSDVQIVRGRWYINGKDCGQAEGKDGTGVSIKGSVDVVLKKDVTGTKKSLQEVNPVLNSSNYNSVLLGDCYVVTDTRHLYTCINDTDWPESYSETWDFRSNWEDIGEFQGEGSYMHIAWATDGAVNMQNGQIQYVHPYFTRYEDLENNVEYNWIGICTDHNKLDPPDNYGDESYTEEEKTWNWKKYKWNHVKGKDGSDYEKVYLRTKTNTPPEFADGYQNASSYQSPEYLPAVKNYSSSQHSGVVSGEICTFTDDPVGVEASWPYEWMAERKKKFDSSTGLMKWFAFSDPSLWATYSFDGITAYLTKSSDNLSIDAAGNAIGGFGTTTQGTGFNPRLYTEVKIYDPKKKNNDNSYGGYLTYQSGTTPSSGYYVITSTGTNCTANSYNGKVYIQSIPSSILKDKTKNSCSIAITAKIYGGKTFNFTYTVTFNRIPQTYLTYTLTNDSDTFTYRTRTKKYDGLPIETKLEVLTTDGTVDKLNDNIDKRDGYIVSTKVVGKGENNLLKYAKITKLNDTTLTGNDIIIVDDEDKTVEIGSTVSGNNVSHNTYTVTIYSDDNYSIATGILLKVKSDGTVSLERSNLTTDVDLPDTTHNLDISCSAKLSDGTQYEGLVKTFKLLERNDATLYKLILPGGDTFVKGDNNSYSPAESNFSVDVNISDESGTTTESIPLSETGATGLVRDNVYVKFLNGRAAITPSQDASYLSWPRPAFSSVNRDFFTVVVVEYDASNNPATYHDIETVNLVPPGVSAVYLDINMDSVTVDCDADGNIIGNSDPSFTIEAYLRWGNLVCKTFSGTDNGVDFTSSSTNITIHNVGYNATTNKNHTAGTINRNTDTGLVSKTITFHRGKYLESGQIKVRIKGEFENGIVKDVTNYIDVIANRTGATGPQGPHGNYKATAFTRTYDIISDLIPSGGNYDSQNYPNPTTVGSGSNVKTYTWHDGIPEGEETLWSTTGTFLGANYPSGPSAWSNPSIVQDSEIYDVEFAERQEGGSTPSIPIKYEEATVQNPCNSHKPSGYNSNLVTDQIWYDPILDRTTLSSISSNIYWKAERTTENGTKGNWIITQIKGESEPWVSVNKDRFTFDVDPTGKLSSVPTDSDKTLTIRLKLGNIVQQLTFVKIVFTAFSESSTTVRTYSTSATSSTYRLTITNDSGTGDSYVSFVLPISSTSITYAPQRNLEITAKTNIYEATKTVKVEFDRKNRSSFKSFVFKRFAVGATVESPSTGSTGGSYANNGLPTGASGRDSGWSDGLPNDGGTNPIYMSSRTFYSDGQPDNDSWSTPVRMSDTDVFDVEFSFADSNPGKPGDTGKNWYDPSGNPPSGNTWADAVWMATNTKNSSGSWSGWVVVKIKGEAGDTGTGINSITPWYKAFDTLDVVIPSAGNETDGWTEDGDLTSAGWTNSYIKPTKENPYLWKFTRTVYKNPPSVVHGGLEMIQVWSENMINPNLLDDTDFIDLNHLGGWNRTATNNAYFGDSEGEIRDSYEGEVLSQATVDTYGNNPKQYYLEYTYPNIAVERGDYVTFLEQVIYYEGGMIKKLNSDTWYTLYFEAFALSRTENTGTDELTINFSDSNNNGIDRSSISWTQQVGDDILTSSGSREFKTSFDYENSDFGNWNKITATFKTKTLNASNNVRIEFRVSPQRGRKQKIYIRKPKLEIGKVATDYISGDAIKDPYPRLTVWGTGKQYYKGNYGEPYLDAVTYGANWFRCRNTHLSNNDNKPKVGQTTAYWEPANNLDFVVTDLLLAETGYIKNLVVGGLMTGDRGTAHVEMKGSEVYFFGNKQFANIRMSVDADGMAYLQFYDKNNNFLYDLGPRGINWLKTVETPASWSDVVRYRKINDTSSASGLYLENIPSSTYTRKDYYQFSAKLVNGTPVADGTYATTNADAESANGKYFTTEDISSTYWATGLHYFIDDVLNKMTEFWYMEKYGNTGNEAINELKNDLRYYGFSDDFLEQLTYEVINPDVHKLKYKILVRRFVYFDNGVIKYPYGLYQYRDVADGDSISGFSMTL